ncbi:MAG: hypothetical protein ACON4H_08875 [Rubripirellula sp.]
MPNAQFVNAQFAGVQVAGSQAVSAENVLGSGLAIIVLGGDRSASSLLGEESSG